MSKPVSPRPLRKAAAICAYSQDDPPLRNPIIGIAVCCARAASGHAAAPPSSVMNSRRFTSVAHLLRPKITHLGRGGGCCTADSLLCMSVLGSNATETIEATRRRVPASLRKRQFGHDEAISRDVPKG